MKPFDNTQYKSKKHQRKLTELFSVIFFLCQEK